MHGIGGKGSENFGMGSFCSVVGSGHPNRAALCEWIWECVYVRDAVCEGGQHQLRAFAGGGCGPHEWQAIRIVSDKYLLTSRIAARLLSQSRAARHANRFVLGNNVFSGRNQWGIAP